MFESVFDFICSLDKIVNNIYCLLPILHTVVTIIFMILGLVGIIAFAAGGNFKNAARNIYTTIHFIISFLSMLILFHITYCSADRHKNSNTGYQQLEQGGGGYQKVKELSSNIKTRAETNINKIMNKFFDVINTLVENNSAPLIIIQVICSTLIVIICNLGSTIYSGISKAGYQMHCLKSKEVFLVPPQGKLVDYFMSFLFFISSVFLILYSGFKMVTSSFKAAKNMIVPDPCGKPNATSTSDEDTIRNAARNLPPQIAEVVSKGVEVLEKYPLMKASFIISLSYYISQSFLRMIEDLISNNIVFLTNWQHEETECSDEKDKASKAKIERGVKLFFNILLFIVLVIASIVFLFGNFMLISLFRTVITQILDKYTPIASLLYGKITPNATDSILNTMVPGAKSTKIIESAVTELASGNIPGLTGDNVTDAPPVNVTDAPPTNVTDAPPANVTDAPPANVTDAPPSS